MRNLQLFLVTAAVIFLVSNHPFEASGRVLNEYDIILQSVQKGVPAPRGHNGCTNIPGRNDPPCINQRGFAGHVGSSTAATGPKDSVQYSSLMSKESISFQIETDKYFIDLAVNSRTMHEAQAFLNPNRTIMQAAWE
ncbi:hypothetical protein Goshw_000659 [Gossypium schwendimanii]|uniref:Uncharacterized protein n=1 Tax=Gossypium schwendimanii TaxID=34291 RepID=A0A7J9KIP0_GOSSC|nr:hypothetical protein [Gossypium schwendimanii]